MLPGLVMFHSLHFVLVLLCRNSQLKAFDAGKRKHLNFRLAGLSAGDVEEADLQQCVPAAYIGHCAVRPAYAILFNTAFQQYS